MASAIAVLLLAVPLWLIYWNYTCLQRNLKLAKESGLPYVIVPVHLYNLFWLIPSPVIAPILGRILPTKWTESWIDYVTPDWCWQLRWEPYEKMGETFITVSPGRNITWVTNAEAILQITQRRENFPKPLEAYKVLDIFGPNVISTDGAEWRMHRKATSPGFNEKNNALVFKESVAQAQGMLRKWISDGQTSSKTISSIPEDTMRLGLHIISRIGFGVQLFWPGEGSSEEEKASDGDLTCHEKENGHTMSFETALTTLIDRMFVILLTPEWILKYLPFKAFREAWQGWRNWDQYMHELMEQKILEARADAESEGLDIMGSLVRRAARDMDLGKLAPKSPSQIEAASKSVFSKTDILGNTFVMILAGHETTANAIHFSLMELSMAPNSQRRLQKDVDTILGETDPAAWDYETNIHALLGGIAGAVLNEELRLMPPVVNIPKCVRRAQPQTITIDGKKFTLPADSLINLNAVGLQANPRYWPSTGPSKVSERKDDLYDFVPERWLRGERSSDASLGSTSPISHEIHTPTESANGEDEDFGGFTGSASAAQLFRPVRGSYIPFSEGGRSCLGRRLAQVEVMAVLSVIFQKYSIELAVDEWASDEDVEGMSDEEKRAVYAKAVKKAREIIRGASSLISLKLHKAPGFVPVRLVRRGSERFLNILE